MGHLYIYLHLYWKFGNVIWTAFKLHHISTLKVTSITIKQNDSALMNTNPFTKWPTSKDCI